MKSPFTGGNVTKLSKRETFTFRNEKYSVQREYYQCDDTGKTVTDAELDDKAMKDLYAQYRQRHGIPSPEALKNLRRKYNLSAHIMSKIAGIGINQYGLYENGEMPTVAIGTLLASLFEKSSLLNHIDNAKSKLGKDYVRVREAVESHKEPVSYPIKRINYSDFNETISLSYPSIVSFPIKRPRWANYFL